LRIISGLELAGPGVAPFFEFKARELGDEVYAEVIHCLG
jgi:hypothetical protein